MRRMKIAVLHVARMLGLFRLARRWTAAGLHILCYHGFSYKDEHRFNSKLFVTKEFFASRLEKIAAMGFTVIGLDQAVARLKAGTLPPHSLVITIDDGWQGTQDIAMPLLAARGFDWTLYLTTYYAEKQTQIMNVALQYLCWKTDLPRIDPAALDGGGETPMPLQTRAERQKAASRLTEIGGALATAPARQDFVARVAHLLNVDQKELEEKRMFYIVNANSVAELAAAGVDIQLHTHRHTLKNLDRDAVAAELEENRAFIEQAGGGRATHFCYPSGFFEKKHFAWLSGSGVVSATTCEPGLNYGDTEVMALNRFLDGENISAIEFEAELSGFLELARTIRVALKR